MVAPRKVDPAMSSPEVPGARSNFCQALANMKQKIVIKLRVPCDKCSSKALALAAKADGVLSVALEGAEKDQVVVVGDGVDAACLTTSLRKKVACVLLVSVEEVKPKDPPQCVSTIYPPCRPQCEMYKIVYEDSYSQISCTIL
ncbi:hypothetical protein CJ030_MR4G021002 [Morella rubra]|uniref:HMA domain-containing protein n=1 Tax=Morella rubra TaxID=262757 RepID=A0A6A1VWK7_9ROSI|nr:hypothetical protein CJ030_MR4G021002 [Morella rubra]